MNEQNSSGEGTTGFKTADLALFAVFSLISIIYVWYFRFLPLQDYPDWLFQSSLFLKALKGQLSRDYQVLLYPVPNSISTILIGLLNLIFKPEISGKLFLTLYIIIFASGSLYMISSSSERKSASFVGYLPFLFLLNTPFFNGNISYVFSLGVLFWGIGYVNNKFNSGNLSIIRLAAISLLLYFSHAISFFAWCIYLSLLLLTDMNKTNLKKFILALTPSLSLLAVYVFKHLAVTAIASGLPGNTGIFNITQNIRTAAGYLSIFRDFYPFLNRNDAAVILFGYTNILFIALAGLLFVSFMPGLSLSRGKDAGIFAGILMFTSLSVFCPIRLAGMVNPGERFIYPALWLFFCLLHSRYNAGYSGLNAALKALITAFILLQAVFIFSYGGKVSGKMLYIYDEFRQYGVLNHNYSVIKEDDFNFENKFRTDYKRPRFLPKHSSLLRLPYYIYMENNSYAPIFSTGIFLDKGGAVSLNSVSSIMNLTYYPEYFIIIGERSGNRVISGLLSGKYDVLRENEFTALLKAR